MPSWPGLSRPSTRPPTLARCSHVMPGLVPGISLSKPRRTQKNAWMPGTSPGMTARERGRGEERLQPQINCEAGFAGIKWDKWDSTGQAPPSLLCRGPMTLPSEHHGAIFAQAPRAVHRTLVRVTGRAGRSAPSPPAPSSPQPSPPPRGGEGEKAAPPACPLRPLGSRSRARPVLPTFPLRLSGEGDTGRWVCSLPLLGPSLDGDASTRLVSSVR